MKKIANTSAAIFIDGDWLYATLKRINKKFDYTIFYENLVKRFGAGTKIHYFGTFDKTNKQQQRFYISLAKFGYIIHHSDTKKAGDKIISCGQEINLAVNAMWILPALKEFILVSGDSDFAALLQRAKQYGVHTYVIALPFSTGYLLRQVTKTFLNLESFVEYKQNTNGERGRGTLIDQNYIRRGESFNSYILLRNLLASAKKRIIIIDSYIDDQILLMIQLLEPKIIKIIITDIKKITPLDFFVQLDKLKKDGHRINIYDNKRFHDRFVGIDNTWWHSGHSIKNFGERDSMLNKVKDRGAQIINDGLAETIKQK